MRSRCQLIIIRKLRDLLGNLVQTTIISGGHRPEGVLHGVNFARSREAVKMRFGANMGSVLWVLKRGWKDLKLETEPQVSTGRRVQDATRDTRETSIMG